MSFTRERAQELQLITAVQEARGLLVRTERDGQAVILLTSELAVEGVQMDCLPLPPLHAAADLTAATEVSVLAAQRGGLGRSDRRQPRRARMVPVAAEVDQAIEQEGRDPNMGSGR